LKLRKMKHFVERKRPPGVYCEKALSKRVIYGEVRLLGGWRNIARNTRLESGNKERERRDRLDLDKRKKNERKKKKTKERKEAGWFPPTLEQVLYRSPSRYGNSVTITIKPLSWFSRNP
jgi:hypothetical protein